MTEKERIEKLRDIAIAMKELAVELYENAMEMGDEDFEKVVFDVVSRFEVLPSPESSLREAINFAEYKIDRPFPFA